MVAHPLLRTLYPSRLPQLRRPRSFLAASGLERLRIFNKLRNPLVRWGWLSKPLDEHTEADVDALWIKWPGRRVARQVLVFPLRESVDEETSIAI